jgi:hypothetical protein
LARNSPERPAADVIAVVDTMTPSPRNHEAALHAGWRLAVRVATASSVLMVAVAVALQHFVGLADRYVLVLAIGVGLLLGAHLPAARPIRPAWLPARHPERTHR